MTKQRTNTRIRHVRVWSDRKTGRQYARFRRRGYPERQLPTPVDSEAFREAYAAAMAGEPIVQSGRVGAARRSPAGSASAALALYFVSPAWTELAAKTRQQRRGLLEKVREKAGATPVRRLDRKFVIELLDSCSGHGRKHMRSALRGLMRWAVASGLVEEDPSHGVGTRVPKSPGYLTWSESEIAQFEARHPIGTMERLMFSLALNTGQRRGDLIRIGRQHFRRGVLHLKQTKTGAQVAIPVLPDLQAAIDAAMGPALANFRPLLANPRGGPFSPDYATAYFAQACRAAGLPPRLSLHGLRKACCRRLAEATCSVHEIMSISGHKTLVEVERYCREYSRTTAAVTATAKLERMLSEQEVANQVANQ